MDSFCIHFLTRLSNADENENLPRSCDRILAVHITDVLLSLLPVFIHHIFASLIPMEIKVEALSFKFMYNMPICIKFAWITHSIYLEKGFSIVLRDHPTSQVYRPWVGETI